MGNEWEKETITSGDVGTFSADVDPGANGHSELAQPDENLFGLSEPTFDGEISETEIKDTLNKSLAPRGTYTTDPENHGPMTVTKVLLKAREGKQETDRRMINVSGRVRGYFKDRGDVTTFVRQLRLSPDLRPGYVFDKETKQYTDELSGKDDSASNRWAEAVAAYQKTYKEFPRQESTIIDFLESGKYGIRLVAIDGELRVVGISEARGR